MGMMPGVLQVGQSCGGFAIIASKGMSHSCPLEQRKGRIAISKLPPSILIALPLSMASAIFCLADPRMRAKVGRETRMLSAHCSCSRASKSFRRIASASSMKRQIS